MNQLEAAKALLEGKRIEHYSKAWSRWRDCDVVAVGTDIDYRLKKEKIYGPGDRFKGRTCGFEEEFILARVEKDRYVLISTECGNRWSNPVYSYGSHNNLDKWETVGIFGDKRSQFTPL